MSLNAKTIVFSLLILAVVPFAGWRYYKSRHTYVPKPIPPREEVSITILPGWSIRDVAEYLVKQGVASTTAQVYAVTGKAAVPFKVPTKPVAPADSFQKFDYYNFEGYLAPETIRFFKGVKAEEVVERFFEQRMLELTEEMRTVAVNKKVTFHELLTLASIVEREARGEEARQMVADILWRRWKSGMALQVDSSVHYIFDRTGDVYTTQKERESISLWNTYKYPGLPPGPICMPSTQSIEAVLYPKPNKYVYFLTGTDGTMHYAATLDEHNRNRFKYLR